MGSALPAEERGPWARAAELGRAETPCTGPYPSLLFPLGVQPHQVLPGVSEGARLLHPLLASVP